MTKWERGFLQTGSKGYPRRSEGGTQRVPAILMGLAQTPLGLAIISLAASASGISLRRVKVYIRNDEVGERIAPLRLPL
jgi:hypothetical protein